MDMEYMKFILCPLSRAHEINVIRGVVSTCFYKTTFKPFQFLFTLDHWMANLQADLHAFLHLQLFAVLICSQLLCCCLVVGKTQIITVNAILIFTA
jgi:hypothetical protein